MIRKNIFFIIVTLVCACITHNSHEAFAATKERTIMQLTSSAFTEGGMLPVRYTCDGQDISPPLNWKDLPPGTRSLALICDDPDAPIGTWVHWVVFNIPPQESGLTENIQPDRKFKNGMRQGNNDWKKIGYGGPCPPGGIHRYFFKLYALDTELNLKPGVTKKTVLKAMEGHILDEAQLMGKYKRR
jgi:hypothetical protein